MTLNPSPLVALNRVVALWKARGLAAASAAIGRLQNDPALAGYYLLPAVRGRLLAEAGETLEARRAYQSALTLPCSQPERRLLLRQLERLT
jgi:RNA polymerase sigma-70 factor (ECF subfamily)